MKSGVKRKIRASVTICKSKGKIRAGAQVRVMAMMRVPSWRTVTGCGMIDTSILIRGISTTLLLTCYETPSANPRHCTGAIPASNRPTLFEGFEVCSSGVRRHAHPRAYGGWRGGMGVEVLGESEMGVGVPAESEMAVGVPGESEM